MGDKITDIEIIGRLLENGSYNTEFTIPFTELGDVKFHSRHYFGHFNFTYRKPRELLFVEYFKLFYFQIFYEKYKQWRFNSKTKERTDKIELLKHIIDIRLERGIRERRAIYPDLFLDQHQIFRHIYGDRMFNHPRYDEILERFSLTLESLVSTGDVEVLDYRYKATGKSLETIANYEEENRKHQDQVIHNSWIKGLTVILALTAIATVGFQIHDITSK